MRGVKPCVSIGGGVQTMLCITIWKTIPWAIAIMAVDQCSVWAIAVLHCYTVTVIFIGMGDRNVHCWLREFAVFAMD